jgi:hypothetical protein
VTRTVVQRTFSLDEARAGLDSFSRGTLGKVVITTV